MVIVDIGRIGCFGCMALDALDALDALPYLITTFEPGMCCIAICNATRLTRL